LDYVDKTFDGEKVELDGNSFENCTFRDVTFQYAGGHLVMKNCSMDRFRFQFGGDHANGLFALYQLFGTEALLQLIRGFTEPGSPEVELELPNTQ
jgi:hypothetical protein